VSGRVAEFGWFAEPALLVLVSLSHGPKHGYAIVHDIEHGTGRVAQIGLRHLDRTSP
jgi:DNA-binding PadR family transcriptional regulator